MRLMPKEKEKKQNQSVRDALTKDLDQAEWAWIMKHSERDAVILVSPAQDLVEVGVQVAVDNAELISAWVDAKQIQKPTLLQLAHWNGNPTLKFMVLVVAPYVLVQEVGQKH